MNLAAIKRLLGKQESDYLLKHHCKTIPSDMLHQPSLKTVTNVFWESDRPKLVQSHLREMYQHGRLRGTGYLSILPVDQGIEHTAGESFSKNPEYFDPENLVRLAMEGGCNAIASTVGALGIVSKKYAHKIPFIVKLNHNELLTYPQKHDQVMFASPEQARNMGALGVGATIYFGSAESNRQIVEVSRAFAEAHKLGLFTVLWCYVRNNGLRKGRTDFQSAADLTAQANHLGVTIQADIIKQKLPTADRGFQEMTTPDSAYGTFDPKMYTSLMTDHPIDLARFQVANCYLGRIPLISSGGPSNGKNDLNEAVRSAIINKRAGGSGLIMGRKAFQRSMDEGVKLLHAVQDVYLNDEITIA